MAKISMELIQELRARTKMGMMDCKNALEQAQGNLDQALEILRQKGASIAAKRADRETSQGIIHAYIHPGDRIGVLVQLTCETDFVAQTEAFKDLAHNLALHIAALKPSYLSKNDIPANILERERQLFREQLAASTCPPDQFDRQIERKLAQFSAESCLLTQQYIKDDQRTIEELLKELIAQTGENITIQKFARFEIGE